MIYTFLTDADIKTAIREDLLSKFAENDTELQKYIRKTERTAIQQIKSKIRDRYDVALIFPVITQWKLAKQYNEGEYVYNEGVIYIALSNNINLVPANEPTTWEMRDPRHDLIINYCVDITLFHLHKRINPRKIPDLRKDTYTEALAWFELLKIGEESPDLPFLEDGEEYIPWGSNPQIEHIY